MNFKAQADKDILQVFHASDEFAEDLNFYYNDKPIQAKVVLDYSEYTDRQKPGSDHVEGLFEVDLIMFIALDSLGQMPRKGQQMTIKDEDYNITKVKNEMGELTIYLERLME